jgi:AhpD family alkylhydroperoxidase
MTAEPAHIDYATAFPAGVEAMVGLHRAVDAAGIEPLLLEVVKMPASQIDGCACCLDMHSKDARALGESERRLHLLAASARGALLRRAGAGGVGLVCGPHPYFAGGHARCRLRRRRAGLLSNEIVALTPQSSPSTDGTGWRSSCARRSANTSHRTTHLERPRADTPPEHHHRSERCP